MSDADQVACTCNNAWCALTQLYEQGGVGVLAFLFIAYIFYKMVWKVWTSAMRSKDQEIQRLIDQRNFYQDKLFPNRLSAAPEQPTNKEDV